MFQRIDRSIESLNFFVLGKAQKLEIERREKERRERTKVDIDR